jgi:DNA-binding MarR family transcriptional regulator
MVDALGRPVAPLGSWYTRVMKEKEVSLAHLDLAYLGQFVGQAANEAVRQELERRGMPHLRPSHGYLVQRLLEGPQTVSDLARQLGITQQAVSKSVGELEAAGYVGVVAGDDARVRLISLSAKGRRSVTTTRAIRAKLDAELARTLGAARHRAAKAALVEALEALGGAETVRTRRVRPST